MKKTILFLAAAAVALVACNKTEPAGSENADNGSPRFRISVNIPTKNANAYTETTAGNLQDLIVYGGLKQNGQVLNKSILWANDEPMFAYLSNNDGSGSTTSYYFLTGNRDGSLSDQLLLPLGTTLDAIFLGGFGNVTSFPGFDQSGCYDNTSDRSEFDDYSTYGTSFGWNKPVVFEKDNTVADYLAFKYVNTDQQQFDVVYGVKNDIKSSTTPTTITLKHAQALINLNVKVTNPDAASSHVSDFYILFIDVNAVASNGTLKDYLLGQQSGASSSIDSYNNIMNNFYSEMSSPSYDAYMPLKKVGDFVIDNTRNTPVAEWRLYQWNAVAVSSDYANVMLLNDASISSSINPFASQTMSNSFTSGVSDYLQAGSQLIPEQPTVNPWLYYKIDGRPYLTEVNIPRGIWERGHVYTYNLNLTFGDMRFTIEVEPYDTPIVFEKDL